ncbi:hypothetical protein HPB47_001701 [Ixodes persulcatus]|uniref:Uncharacterized protein n=1 Tax=Ixodes persulcatus TaxID=34615 RepID=A0AC60PN99_IXOPE|nr:hypothetical protein HPB47_001701 [Ixodes persulcatus]
MVGELSEEREPRVKLATEVGELKKKEVWKDLSAGLEQLRREATANLAGMAVSEEGSTSEQVEVSGTVVIPRPHSPVVAERQSNFTSELQQDLFTAYGSSKVTPFTHRLSRYRCRSGSGSELK